MAENKTKYPLDITCPRQLYGFDLKNFIQEKSNEGHQILIMGDFNSQYCELIKWMNSHGCIDILNNKYGTCPITYQRSFKDPLDCFFGDPAM